MAAVTTAVPTAEDLQKLSTKLGRVTGEVESALWRLEKTGEAEERQRIDAAELGNLAYFAEGLRLDGRNLQEWADKIENEAHSLFGGWPAEKSPE